MKPPLRKPRRKRQKTLQLTFVFPAAVAAPRPPIHDSPFVEAADVPNSGSRTHRNPEAAAAWDFEPGKPTQVITRDCLDHLPSSQIFAAVADDPRPTGSGE